MADDIRYLGVAQHAAAVGKRRALHPHNVAIGSAQIELAAIVSHDKRDALGNIRIKLGCRDAVGAGIAPVIHQGDK